MIIVLEGIDGAGKTSLAAELAATWSSQGVQTMYVHNGASDEPLKDYTRQLLEALEFSRDGGNVIIDRYNLGEQVYPHTRRGGRSGVTQVEDDVIVQIGAQLGVRWLVLLPSARTAYDRLLADGEDPDLELLQAERDAFIAVLRRHQERWPQAFGVVTYDAPKDVLVRLVTGQEQN